MAILVANEGLVSASSRERGSAGSTLEELSSAAAMAFFVVLETHSNMSEGHPSAPSPRFETW